MNPEELFDTQSLVQRAREGDERAVELLYRRYIARVERWTHGRVPLAARDLHDTQTVAHDVLVRSLLKAVDEDGGIRSSFRAYVKQALRNQLSDLGRRRKEVLDAIDDDTPDDAPTELELMLEREFEQRVRRGIDALSREHRQLLFLRFELGTSYADLAQHLQLASEDAARMRVNRVVGHLRESLRAAS